MNVYDMGNDNVHRKLVSDLISYLEDLALIWTVFYLQTKHGW